MKKFKGLLILTVFLIIFMTSSFAWLNISIKGEKINILKAGDLSLILDETSSEGINIEGAVPVSDEKGLSQEGYTFKLVNNGTVAANYIITLDDLEIETSEERMSDDILKYSLTKNGVEGSNVFLPSIKVNNKRVVDRGVIDAKTTNTYTLKLWMDYDTTNEGMNKIFAAKLNVDVEQENIKVEKSDKTIDINNKTETLGLEEDISNYIVESSDEEVAVIDSLGNIVGKHHGTVVFKVRNKKTGAKKEISVTITKTLKATFVKQLGVENISKEEATCLLKEKEEKSCSITLPEITPEQGYTKVGWSTEKGSHTGTTSMIDISKDSNLYTIVKKDEIVYTATFNKQVTGVSQIESTTVSCTIPSVYNEEKQEESCKIKLPTVEMKEGYSFVGWNTKKDATTGYKGQEEIELDSNKEFYPIVKKDAIILTAKFYKNGADFLDGVQDEVITKTCILEEKYNGEVQDTECSITTPEIKAGSATPNVVGYSENKDAITSDIGSKTSLTLSSNKEYYAITKSDIKTYSARFYKNGAASLDEVQDEFVTRKCNIPSTYNGKVQKSSCRVTSPEIKASSKTPIVLGYSESMDNHTVILNSNTETNISSDVNYYAQTKKDKVIYTATFKVGKNVTSVEKESNTCTIEATYNGDVQGTSCSIEGPSITTKTGYTSVGWSTTNGSTTGSTSLELTENTTFYANATSNSYTVEYYDGNTKLGSSGVKVDEELTLTTIAALNGEKSGYTFKGWATTEGSTQVVHNDGATVSNLSTTEGAVVKLYAVFVDDIKPICSFSSTKEIYVTAEDNLTLTCTDEGSKIANTNLQISNFEVSNDSGSIVSVSNPVEIENGYKYTVSIKGLKAGESQSTNGTFTISLKENSIIDNSNNGNIKETSSEEVVKGYTYSINYEKSEGVESIASTKTSCTTILDNLTCDVTLPGINELSGYTKDGWYNGVTKVGSENTLYTLDSNNTGNTLSAKATPNSYTVYFDSNGGKVEEESKTVTYKGTYGTLPIPTKEGYEFLGWYNTTETISFELLPQNSGNDVDNYNNYEVLSDIKPGIDYTIGIDKAMVTSGSSNGFTTFLFDYTTNNSFYNQVIGFGNNVMYVVNSPDILDSNHNNKILIYSGIASGTRGIGTKYENVKISTNGSLTDKNIISSDIYNTSHNQQLFAHWKKVEAPIIISDNNDWSISKNISVKTKGTALTGVKNYEYYISDNDTLPTNNTTPTSITDGNVEVDSEGIHYIWYRTVSNSNVKSDWSNMITIKIDKTNPTLNLSKETYIEGFNNWDVSGASIDNNILSIDTGTASHLYPVNGEYWYVTLEFKVNSSSESSKEKCQILMNSEYYDVNGQRVTSSNNGNDINGYAPEGNFDAWNFASWDGWSGWGKNVKYVLFSFSHSTTYAPLPFQIKDFKIHGQLTNSFYDIYVTKNDNTGISKVKYAKGNYDTTYFKTSGTEVTEDSIRVTENGIYTVYVEDSAGNSVVSTIEITNIG